MFCLLFFSTKILVPAPKTNFVVESATVEIYSTWFTVSNLIKERGGEGGKDEEADESKRSLAKPILFLAYFFLQNC